MRIVYIVGAFLQMNANRLLFGLADQGGVNMSATYIGETANVTAYFSKIVRPFPGNSPGTNAARTGTRNGSPFRVIGQSVRLGNFREDFFDQEPGIIVTKCIVFDTAISRYGLPPGFEEGISPGLMKMPIVTGISPE